MGLGLLAILSFMSALTTYALHQSDNQHQSDLLNREQDYQSEREDINYQRNLNSDRDRFDILTDMGVNPNIAMQSILGGSGFSPASADSSPSAPSVNPIAGEMGNLLQNSIGKIQDNYLKNAEIKNLEANTNKTDVESGLLPRDFQLREMSTIKQLQVWDKSVEKMSSEIGLTDEQTNLVKQQNLYYGRKTEAEINAISEQANKAIADAKLALQKIEESKASERELDARTAVDYSQAGVNDALRSNIIQDTSNKVIEGEKTYYESERTRIAKEFEENMSGVPLTADARQRLSYLVEQGKYDEAQKFLDCIFQSALRQSVGESMGAPQTSFGLPFGIFNHKSYVRPASPSTYIPYWNPVWN